MKKAEFIDSVEKIKELEEAANEGYARAQFNLAMCYEQGKLVEQDLEKAIMWYKKAAEQGNLNACYIMGNRYYNGDGVEHAWCIRSTGEFRDLL